jgi:hypothetical protein
VAEILFESEVFHDALATDSALADIMNPGKILVPKLISVSFNICK